MQNRLYMKDIGPLPPYPFLTFTLMQLLLYVFFPFAYHSYMNDLDHTYVYEWNPIMTDWKWNQLN